MLQAGDLRDRVTLKRTTEAEDEHGGFDATTSTVASRLPAKVTQLSGRALEHAQQVDPRATHEVVIRLRSGLRSGQTLTWHDPDEGDRALEIVGTPVSERRVKTVIVAKEIR